MALDQRVQDKVTLDQMVQDKVTLGQRVQDKVTLDQAKCLGKSWPLGITLGLQSQVSGQKLASGGHLGAS